MDHIEPVRRHVAAHAACDEALRTVNGDLDADRVKPLFAEKATAGRAYAAYLRSKGFAPPHGLESAR